MVGGSMLVLPLLFSSSGIIISTIIMIISGIFSWKTCSIYTEHLKEKEMDISDSIYRILGNKWRILFVIISTIYLFVMSLLYYYLIIDMTYNIFIFIFVETDFNHFTSNEIFSLNFTEFSQ